MPVKAAAEYLRRLVQQGFRVSICEQTEDPKQAKGIVRREVVETITPGAAFSDDLLDGARNNFLCATFADGDRIGIAAADLSTGEFRLIVAATSDTDAVISRLSPREILVARDGSRDLNGTRRIGEEGPLVTEREAWEFDAALASTDMARHFGVASVEGLGIGPTGRSSPRGSRRPASLHARASARRCSTSLSAFVSNGQVEQCRSTK